MRLRTAAAFASTLLAVSLAAQTPAAQTSAQTSAQTAAQASVQGPIVITGGDIRPAQSLNGPWASIIDPYFSGLFSFHHEEKKNGFFLNRKAQPGDPFPTEYDFDKAPKLNVPGDWNTQRPELLYYEGPMWYERSFPWQLHAGKRVFLRVGAANYRSWFWVNGKKVCEHEGGFTAFNCEVTQQLHDGDNFVVAAVENTRLPDGVPGLETDWWNYGGLTREVSLIEVPEAFIVQYHLSLSRTEADTIEGFVYVLGATNPTEVRIEIPALHAQTSATTDSTGRALIHFNVQNLERWSPDSPKLYDVNIAAGDDQVHEHMGFRTIEARGDEILLNGKPIFLRGMSVHAEAPIRTGRAWSREDAETLLGWVKELGGNFARLAHYPHDENMLRAADRMGVLIWSENPVYWALDFSNPAVLAKAEQQLDEEIGTSRNHAAIILWSMANETPNTPARTAFIKTLAARARALDSSRLITAALLVRGQGHTKIIDDPLGEALDVIGFNEYIGWYEGKPENCDVTDWRVSYQKPLIVSEFGGGAKYALHGAATERWTEEYQAAIYQHQFPMLNRIPQLRGMSPWVLMDFRSPNRPLTGIQDGFNRKGLLDEHGHRKMAFGVLKKAYTEKSVGKPE